MKADRLVRVWTLVLATILFADAAKATEFRSLTGINNNLVPSRQLWGCAGQNLFRITTPDYLNDGAALRLGPNTRTISNIVFDQPATIIDENGLSQFHWAFGQLLAHDTDLTPLQEGDGAEHIDITIPPGDPFFIPGQSIPVTRSIYDTSTERPFREHPNVISSFIDASMVYGGASDEMHGGQDRADWLRDPEEPARLRTITHSTGSLLPQNAGDPTAPGMAMDARMGAATFIAGDRRANEHPVLMTMHTLFVREHNRIADVLRDRSDIAALARGAGLTEDEYVYQRARKIVGAEIQAITYQEYVPALGVDLSTFTGYSADVDPTISPEFAVAAFRLGHTQVNGAVPRLDEQGNSIPEGELDLIGSFFDPSKLTNEGGLDPIIRGLASSPQEATDAKIRDGLRNLLFGPPSPGPVANGSDLAALNTIRGRDHGLPTYQQAWRELIGEDTAPTSFSDITSDPDLVSALAAAYPSVDQVDLWVGLLSEDHALQKSVGPLMEVILSEQFERLRHGDRFYYEIDPDLMAWNTFGPQTSDLEWLQDLRLADVIRMNTGVDFLQDDVFFAAPIPEPSTSLGVLTILLLALGGRRRRRR
jgi:hypothetical protein